MVAVPAATAVTTPSASTLAMASSSDDQATASGAPLTTTTSATRLAVSPTSSAWSPFVMVTLVTEGSASASAVVNDQELAAPRREPAVLSTLAPSVAV